jgi:hypothetical protein
MEGRVNLTQISLLMILALGLMILIFGWRFKQSHGADMREFDQFYKRIKSGLEQSPRQPHKSTVVPPDPPPTTMIRHVHVYQPSTNNLDLSRPPQGGSGVVESNSTHKDIAS